MVRIDDRLTQLKRAPLLSKAARAGAKDYYRNRHLQQILPDCADTASAQVLGQLLDAEETLERSRKCGAADYQPRLHVMALIAIAAEATAWTADQMKASGIEALRSATNPSNLALTSGSKAGI